MQVDVKRGEDFQECPTYLIRVFNGGPEPERLEGIVYSPKVEIDGHWMIRKTNRECARYKEDIHDVVIGVTSHYDNRAAKVLELAEKFAREVGAYCECEVKTE